MDIGQPGAVAGIDLGALSGSALAVEVAEVPRVYAATRLSAPTPGARAKPGRPFGRSDPGPWRSRSP
jgi:hypothetical protein